MAKTTKPTKQQVAQAKARAGGNNPVKVTDAGLKKLGSVAIMAASLTPVGRGVKTAATLAKAGSAARATARGLKAANKPTKAKASGVGDNSKISVETRRGVLKNTPPARANRTRGGGMATLKRQDAAAKADKLVSNLKNTKPMENVPKDVSDRFNATIKRLAAEEAKKKKK